MTYLDSFDKISKEVAENCLSMFDKSPERKDLLLTSLVEIFNRVLT
jgi:hypothetical protein